MLDLISTTEEIHYENYRQQQMETRKFGEPRVKKLDNPKFKEEEEALRKRFTEQVKSEESRFRQWEQHVNLLLSRNDCVLTIWYSLSLSETDSTRISNWLTVLSRAWKPIWMLYRLDMAGAQAGDNRALRKSLVYYTRSSTFRITLVFFSNHTVSLE